MRTKSNIRRTHYVDLNKLVWNHFRECQAAGLVINGKHLKDQALKYARQMGLDSFRGSEGWLDAFKRRHKIDLKTMSGTPVQYENGIFDDVDVNAQLLQQDTQYQPSPFFGNSAMSSVPEEFASTFIHSLNGLHQQQVLSQQEPTTSNHLQTMINTMMTNTRSSPLFMDPTSGLSLSSPSSLENSDRRNVVPTANRNLIGSGETLQNVMRSCQIKIDNKEVNHALDTIRMYILANDQSAMGMLVALQEKLATIKTETDETQTITTNSTLSA